MEHNLCAGRSPGAETCKAETLTHRIAKTSWVDRSPDLQGQRPVQGCYHPQSLPLNHDSKNGAIASFDPPHPPTPLSFFSFKWCLLLQDISYVCLVCKSSRFQIFDLIWAYLVENIWLKLYLFSIASIANYHYINLSPSSICHKIYTILTGLKRRC